MKKFIIILAAICLLSGCTSLNQPQVTDNPEVTEPQVTAEPQVETTVTTTAETTALPETESAVTEPELKAPAYWELFESPVLHLVFTEKSSFDGENIMEVEREFFSTNDMAVFVDDEFYRLIVTPIQVLVIDDAAKTYNVFDNSEENTQVWGFYVKGYEFVSATGNTETYTAKYNGGELTSVWTFNADGTVTVEETLAEAGYYYLYDFKVIDTDVSGMPDTLPEDYIISEDNQWEAP